MTDVRMCLWYDDNAHEAVEFYATLFDDLEITQVDSYGEDPSTGEPGTVMAAAFTLNDQRFLALNGGPSYTLSPAASIQVTVADQDEVDRLWDALTADGGTESQSGWLIDRFGLSWQIIPARFYELFATSDPEAAARVTQAMMAQTKLVVAELEDAAEG